MLYRMVALVLDGLVGFPAGLSPTSFHLSPSSLSSISFHLFPSSSFVSQAGCLWSGCRLACLPLPFICLPLLFTCLPVLFICLPRFWSGWMVWSDSRPSCLPLPGRGSRLACLPLPFIPNSHAMGSCKTNRRTGAVGSPSELVGGWCPGHVLMASGSCDAGVPVSRSCFD